MATFYKRNGKKKKNSTWYFQYYDETGRRLTVRGCADKSATEQIARKLEVDVALRKAGVIDSKADRYSSEGRKAIAEHLHDWEQNMLSRGVTDKQVRLNMYRAKRIFKLVNIQSLADITPSLVQSAIGRIRDEGSALKTCNDTLQAVKAFCNWSRQDGRLLENPLDSLRGFNTATDRRHDRRALTDDELRRLISAAKNGPVLQECSGSERALLYRLAVLTGLRKSEIASLRKTSFDWSTTPSTVAVEAAFSKHRRKDTIPFPEELNNDLQRHLAGRSDNEPALNVPKKTERAIRKDLEAAGIPYRTGAGVADFHALRHTYVTRLVKSGVNPKVAQVLARHSDPRLTLGVYSHVELLDQAKALSSLPVLSIENADIEDQAGEVSKSVGASVGGQAALGGNGGHSTARSKICTDNHIPKKKNMLGTERHPVASDGNRENWSGRRGSNPRRPAWEAGILPLNYSR
jgi:integrase